MQKQPGLPVPLPLQHIDQRRHRLRHRPRPILHRVRRPEIRHREARIVRKDLDAQIAVLDELARRHHAQGRFARPVLQPLHPVRWRSGIQAPVDGADAAGHVDDPRARGCRFPQEGGEEAREDRGAGGVCVEGEPHLRAQWRVERYDPGVVDQHVEFAVGLGYGFGCARDGVVVGYVERGEEFDGAG